MHRIQKVINDNCKLSGLSGLRGWPGQSGRLDGVQLGPVLIEIRLSLSSDQVLEVSRRVSVLVVHHFHHVHALGVDHSEWREALRIKAFIVLQVDEELSGAGVWPEVAKVKYPRLLLCVTGSSCKFVSLQAIETGG